MKQKIIRPAFTPALLATLALVVSSCASVLAPDVETDASALRDGEYALDPAHATLLFKIGHLELSTYVGRFNDFSASLDFDAAKPENARLQASVDVRSLDVNDASFAEKLIGPAWFDTQSHPEARFVSTGITLTGETTGVARGDLTLKGIIRPATMDVTFIGGARNNITQRYTVGFEGKMVINRMDFGIDRYQGLLSDEVTLEFYGEFIRQ
ncbi:YceI family protein [Parvularcula sp. IMCC14364]|uniref:YceI family protein n=1 Tax=Parvularcula sp. IMCC14364 TaxID=3067902 RepID=UPI002741BF5C|nr:YceI family protein [Parvularcula sp. IMCC14364]